MDVLPEDEQVKTAEGIREEVIHYMTSHKRCRIDTEEHVTYVCTQIDRIIEMLKERTRDPLQVAVQKLQKKIDTILELKTPTTPTYAQIATRKVQKPKKEVILVDPESEEDDAERTKQKLKKKINPKKMGIGIQSVRKLRRGGVAIEVATTEEREKLRKAIETKAGLKTKVPSRRKPRVVLYGVATDITKDEITECLY
ncbi:uncharacterized protein LOC111629057 [Centruroides sculpturatus]|uniref:uncharacterized protein LOC111629057 n=1 Tax=Centruroides sculpturatus TaxID=218467 RepID=UPI000C6D75D5|nr:uncharacterized protein LOC111629057 [Centruroides sculpturatus]